MSIKKNIFAPLASGLGATRRAAMLLLVTMLTSAGAWATITGGGTASNPYVINNNDDWNTFSNENNAAIYWTKRCLCETRYRHWHVYSRHHDGWH